MMEEFPFRILGFHCDNGSEFLNETVARLLNELLIEFTKSRAFSYVVTPDQIRRLRREDNRGEISRAGSTGWMYFDVRD